MALSQNVVRDTISAIHKGANIHAVADILGVTESTVYYRINSNKLIFEAAIEKGMMRKSPPITPTIAGREIPTENEPEVKNEDTTETLTTKQGGKVVTNFNSIHADVRLIGSLPDVLALLRTIRVKGAR